jgi:Lhr-like helicase
MSKIDNLRIDNNSLDSLIEEINSTVFSKEEWVSNEFYKIPEMTYSYKKL